jgi:multicomponent Na+:H+ antiporter subunit B
MSARGRSGVFLLGAGLLLATLVIGVNGLPAFGHVHTIYSALVQRIEPPTRRATDLVTSLNFDLRAFDTLGEEFILFASVSGVALLLRHVRAGESDADSGPQRPPTPEAHPFSTTSDALHLLSLVLVPLLVALGFYVIIHGALTPGGGFQGGVVLAAAPIAALVAGRYVALKRDGPDWALDAFESTGATAYVLIGIGGLVFSGAFLQNFLPPGSQGDLLSAGTMPLNSLAVGIEVTGAFLLIWSEFLDQTLVSRSGGSP